MRFVQDRLDGFDTFASVHPIREDAMVLQVDPFHVMAQCLAGAVSTTTEAAAVLRQAAANDVHTYLVFVQCLAFRVFTKGIATDGP